MLTQPNKLAFEQSYRHVCAELEFRDVEGSGVPKSGYTVLHVRGGDKRTVLTEFNTVAVLQQIPPGTIVVVVTDDFVCAAGILREYRQRQHNASLHIVQLSVAATSYNSSTKHNKLLRDFTVLLGADAIIQHSPRAWSAFSNSASMMRQVPLLSTWRPNAVTPSPQRYIGLLAVLQHEEDCPSEFFSSNSPSEVARFLDKAYVKTTNLSPV